MKTYLHLIRHGRTEGNDRHLYYGSTDLPLSSDGKLALNTLSKIGRYPNRRGCRFYTSGMLRTEQTLSLLYGKVRNTVLPDLREMNFGDFEMHSYEELRNRLDYQAWISNYAPSRRCPNGESELEFTSRVTAAAVNLFKGENAIVFCHGGTISAIMAFCFSAEGKNRWEWQPDPGQGYSLILKNGMPVEYRSIPRISNIGGGNVIKKVNPLLQSAAGD